MPLEQDLAELWGHVVRPLRRSIVSLQIFTFASPREEADVEKEQEKKQKRGRKNRGEDGESRVWVSRDMGKKRREKKGSVRLVGVNSNEPKAPKQRQERQEPRDSRESRGRSHKGQKWRENHRGTPGWGA